MGSFEKDLLAADTFLHIIVSPSIHQLNNGSKLTLGHCNVQGGLTGLSKCMELEHLIHYEKLDILCLNETNLKSDIDTNTLRLPINYQFVRKDRSNDSGHGGCGILISKNIKFKIYEHKDMLFPTDRIEAIWIHLTDPNIYLCCFYRSEQFCPLDSFLDYMTECMMKMGGKRIIWLGDVNVDQNNINSLNYKKLDVTMRLFGMVQVVQEMTRIAKLGNILTQSTIDVVITNMYSMFLLCKVLNSRIGDHQAIKIVLDFNVDKCSKFKKVIIRDHCKHNLKTLKQFLTQCCDYSALLESNNVNSVADGLLSHLKTCYEQFCPTKQIKCHSNYIDNPSKELLQNISLKHKLWKKIAAHRRKNHSTVQPQTPCIKCDALWKAYTIQRNHTTKLSRENKRTNIVKELQAKSAANDLRGVWKTIKKASNLPTKGNNTDSNLDPEETNKFFVSIGTEIQTEASRFKQQADFKDYLEPINANNNDCFDAFDKVSEEEVVTYVNSVSSSKSTNDLIPLKVFKQILPSIITPITHVINLSLSNGIMPDICKSAMVTPIYKSESTNEPSNYRPISLLPILGKTIEYFVNKQLTQFIEDKDLITIHQYGFRKDHSTTYLMLDLFDNIYSSKSEQKHPAIIFLDIKKAFDSVNHEILLTKLEYYGIRGMALKWFSSFLSGRSQQTRVGSRVSTSRFILSGVPQGSILGPLLFCLFINDLPFACKMSKPYLFADDGALYFNNICRGYYRVIQAEIKSIFLWLQANKLSLNSPKTKLLLFDSDSSQDCIITDIDDSNSVAITECKSQKYLGLIVDSKLNFHEHVSYIKKKVAKRIGAMYRSKGLLPLKYRKIFANALMLPQFDYLDIIWSKTYKKGLSELDILYKKVAKIALGVDIRERSLQVYKNMGWLPLHLRRQLHLCTYMYRIINSLCPKHFPEKFSYVSGGSRDGEQCNLYTKKSKTHKEFYYLGAKAWNNLPRNIRESESAKHFASAYKKLLITSLTLDVDYQINNSYNYFYPTAENS